MATKPCMKCGGLCDACREQVLENVKKVAGMLVSEAVLIAAQSEGKRVFVIPPDPNAKPPKIEDDEPF